MSGFDNNSNITPIRNTPTHNTPIYNTPISNTSTSDDTSTDNNFTSNDFIGDSNKIKRDNRLRRLSLTAETGNRKKENELSIGKILSLNSKALESILFNSSCYKGKKKSLRSILEKLRPKKQCQTVIGHCNIMAANDKSYKFFNKKDETQEDENNKYENSPDKNSYCWLCGTSFDCKNREIDCEHVIPLLFAVLFLGINTTNQIKDENKFTEELIKSYSFNYLYAHNSCNRKKSNMLLIDWDDTNKKMIFNEKVGNLLQKRLLESNLPNVIAHKTNPKYITDMMNNFKSKIEKICNIINEEYNIVRQEKSDTGYVKYIISMAKLYLSKKQIENLESDIKSRNELTHHLYINPTASKQTEIQTLNTQNDIDDAKIENMKIEQQNFLTDQIGNIVENLGDEDINKINTLSGPSIRKINFTPNKKPRHAGETKKRKRESHNKTHKKQKKRKSIKKSITYN